MGRRGRRARCDLGVPHRPGLGPGRALRPRPGPRGHHVCARGRVRHRHRGLRRRVLRDQPQRGARDGPAAAAAARSHLGGPGERRHRPAAPGRQPDRHVRGHVRLGLQRVRRGLPDHRRPVQRRLRPRRLHPGPARAGPDRGHRVLLVAGRAAPGRPLTALGGVRPGPGRRRDRDVHPPDLPGIRPPARPGPRRAVQVLRRRRGRHRLVRGRRRPGPGTPVRRPPPRAHRAGPAARQRGQPGRRVQRPDRPQRPRAAARDPRRARRRRPDPRRHRRRRGPRHRHRPGRPDRGPGRPRRLRPGPARRPAAPARLAEVQHRPHPGRRRRRRRHQDDRGHGPRHRAGHLARRRPQPPRRLGRRPRRTGRPQPGMARYRPAAPRGRLLVRDLRHQRPRHPRTGPPAACRAPGPAALVGRAVGAVGQDPRRAARPGPAAARPHRRPRPGRHRPVTGRHPLPVRPPRGDPRHGHPRPGCGLVGRPGCGLNRPAHRPGPRPGCGLVGRPVDRSGGGPVRGGRRPARPERDLRPGRRHPGQDRVRLPRARRPVAGHGRRTPPVLTGVRRHDGPLRADHRPAGGPAAAGHRLRGRRRLAHPYRHRAARAVRGPGLAGRAVALAGGTARRRRGHLAGRDRRRLRGRRAVPGRRVPAASRLGRG